MENNIKHYIIESGLKNTYIAKLLQPDYAQLIL